jgi:hypothetical protein
MRDSVIIPVLACCILASAYVAWGRIRVRADGPIIMGKSESSWPYPDHILLAMEQRLDQAHPAPPGTFKLHGEWGRVQIALDLALCECVAITGFFLALLMRFRAGTSPEQVRHRATVSVLPLWAGGTIVLALILLMFTGRPYAGGREYIFMTQALFLGSAFILEALSSRSGRITFYVFFAVAMMYPLMMAALHEIGAMADRSKGSAGTGPAESMVYMFAGLTCTFSASVLVAGISFACLLRSRGQQVKCDDDARVRD